MGSLIKLPIVKELRNPAVEITAEQAASFIERFHATVAVREEVLLGVVAERDALIDRLYLERKKLKRALGVIVKRTGNGCENFTSGSCRTDQGRIRESQYSATSWCDACVASEALGLDGEA